MLQLLLGDYNDEEEVSSTCWYHLGGYFNERNEEKPNK